MIHKLFPTPIYHENIGALDPMATAFLKNTDYPHEAAGHLHTDDKYILDKNVLKSLKSKIKTHIDLFVHEHLQIKNNINFEIQNSWCNSYDTGEYNTQHWHSNCLLSGVYYAECTEQHSPIIFGKNHLYANLFGPTIRFDLDCEYNENEYHRDFYKIHPVKGDIVIFPSHLLHDVPPSCTDTTRYSIAFNAYPRGSVGAGTCELKL